MTVVALQKRMRAMEDYQYTSLDADKFEIRVLSLHPGSFESPIVVSLAPAALTETGTDSPSLEALSYVWGSLDDLEDITVKGGKDGKLSITADLAEALRYVRDSTAVRLMWVDAICINQEDVEERNSQVRLMYKIYTMAKRVIMWVGPKSEDSDLAMDCIAIMASRVKIHWQTAQFYPTTDESHWADHSAPLPFSDVEHTALFRFFSRSWFERVWVWQEVHLAADAHLLCGVRSIHWHAVRTGVLCLGLKVRPGMLDWPAPEAAYSICSFALTENYPMSALLHETKDSLCSDPRDNVYAVLSFLNQDIQSRIIPDYNMEVREVYKDVLLQHFKMGHPDGPRLLSTVEIRREVPDTPSWVPRWDLPRLSSRLYHGKAAAATLPCIRPLSTMSIEALGVHVTTIGQVEPINLTNDTDQQAVIKEFRRLKNFFLPNHDQDSSRESLYPFLETVTANYVAERNHPPYAWRPSSDDYQPFLDNVFEPNALENPIVDRLLRNMREFGHGRALCTTTDGRFCLSTVGTLPGDIVAVFLGCDSPTILRPTNTDSAQYWMVGEAYCHGIMDGEVLLGPLPEHWRIVIRHDGPSNIDYTAFWNSELRQLSAEDPRLGSLEKGWRRQSHLNEEFQTLFVRDNNGECVETWEDPRLTTHELNLKGVQLKNFELL